MPKPVCTYCPAPAGTRDHVPPKALFPKPRPKDLVSVPACIACNAGYQLDDEYFAATVALRAGVTKSHPGRRLRDKLFRGLREPQSAKFLEMLASHIGPSDQLAPHLNLPEGTIGYLAEAPRLRRVGARIIQALHYHETGTHLHPEYRARAVLLDEADDFVKATLVAPLRSAPAKELAAGAFAYVWRPLSSDSLTSTWLLDFYADFVIIGLTAPSSRLAA